MTAALNALSRIDDGLELLPADRAVVEVFDRHCRWEAQRFCLVCGGPGGPECDSCHIDHDLLIERSIDV